MDVLIIIFMVLAMLVCLFCMVVVTRDVVHEEVEKRKTRIKSQEQEPVVVAEEKPVVATVAPPVEEQEPVVDIPAPVAEESVEEEVVADEANVTFSAGGQTLDEKYLELSTEHRGYYDEIVRAAMAVEGSRRFKNAGYEEYKVGKNRLVRLKIRRGVIVCELVIPNLAFKNYINDNKVTVKQAPAIIKVVDESALSAVKDSMSIAIKAFEEEKAYKKEQAKIRRKMQREAAKAASAEEQQPVAEQE